MFILQIAGFGIMKVLFSVPQTYAQAPSCIPAPSGMVSWWPGDGDANDIVDSNHGSLRNGATFAAGKVDQAFSFDGLNDFVQIADSPNLNAGNAITIDVWVKAVSTGGFQFLVSKFNANSRPPPGNPADDSYALYILPAGGLQWQVETIVGGTIFDNILTVTSVKVLDNQFHHVAGTYDGAVMKVYLDGALVGSKNANGSIPVSSTVLILGGGFNDGIPQFFLNGLLDEVEIYGRSLSGSEIQSIFNAGSDGKCKAPMVSDVTVETMEDTPLTITLAGHDPDNDSLTFSIVSTPKKGTLSEITPIDSSSASVTYAPNMDFVGVDSFKFKANDGESDSNIATVTVQVFGEKPLVSCVASLATVVGTESDDTLVGTEGDDIIVGLGGDDIILGLGGNDIICGGEGNDFLFGNDGEDSLSGGRGNDIMSGGDGNDRVLGVEDNDLMFGGNGDDTILGDIGDDSANGGPGADVIYGGLGNDELSGDDDNDELFGNEGDDKLIGGDGDDLLVGGDGNDELDGGNDKDICQKGETVLNCP